MNLADCLANDTQREALLDACVSSLDAEVATKRGVAGLAVRTGYAAFKKVQPGIARDAFGKLLPHFAPVIQPHWDRAAAQGDVARYFDQRRDEVADALLQVTDRLADRAKNQVLIGIYRSMRGLARPHVRSGVPRIPEILAAVSPTDSLV